MVDRANDQQLGPAGNLVADLNAELGHDSSVRCFDDMLHFHRFEHDEGLILGDALAGIDSDLDHAARHRRRKASWAAARGAIAGCFLDAQRRRAL